MGEVHFCRAARRRGGAAPGHQRRAAPARRRALYTVACRPTGGIVDDLIVYRLAADHYLIVVNAANTDKDLAWFVENAGGACDIRDASDETGLIAFQGPAAERALADADAHAARRRCRASA